MKIAVYEHHNDSFGEIWELSDKYVDEFMDLFQNEKMNEIYDLLQEKGKRIIEHCDYWIRIGEP